MRPILLSILLALAFATAPTGIPWAADASHLVHIRQLTSHGDNGEAYFSWDDTRLIWQSNRGGAGCDKIWMMNTDGSGKHRVSPGRGAHTCSYFLPGDREIVFASTSYRDETCPPRSPTPPGRRYVWPLFPYDIYRADVDGAHLRPLTAGNPKYDAEPIVSPNGKRIVFGSQRRGDFDLYVMDTDGDHVQRLTNRYGYDGGPWWSPDGTKIAWRAWYPETNEEKALWADCMAHDYIVPVPLDLWVMDADGSNKRRLTHNGAVNWAPSWHPDGKHLVFSSNLDDWKPELERFGHNFELYLVDLDGTGRIRLTHNTVFDSFPMFSHDGTRLVWASNRNPDKPHATDIFIADWRE